MLRYITLTVLALFASIACASSSAKLDSGLWHYNAGLYAQAIPKLLSATPVIEKANPSDPRLPTAFAALGVMAMSDKEYKKAEEFFGKGLSLARTWHAADNKLNRNALVHFGNFLFDRERLTEALPLLVEAASISERDDTIPRQLYAIDLDNLGLAYDHANEPEKADECSNKSLQILDRLEQTNEIVAIRAVVLYNIAERLAGRGRNDEAEENYREALAHVGANGEQWRKNVVLNNYAKFLRKIGRESEAKALEDQVKK